MAVNKFKLRFMDRYAKAESYLKNHPFWPSFLTDGGVLSLMLIASIGFTVFCGIKSVKDISPELKFVDISFRGVHSLSYLDINMSRIHVVHHSEGELVTDMITVKHSFSDYIKKERYKEDNLLDIWTTMSLMAYDTLKIGRISFSSNEPLKNAFTIPEVKQENIRGTGMYHTVTDSSSAHNYSNVFAAKRSESDTVVFTNVYYGDFFKSNSTNPYIYLNFRLESSITTELDSSAVRFFFSEKDLQLGETLSPVNIINVFPEPSYISPSYIVYKGEQLYKMIRNGGFTFLGEDLSIKRKTDRANFLWTVLFGTAIALTIDILVHLILKWRKLTARKEQETDYVNETND